MTSKWMQEPDLGQRNEFGVPYHYRLKVEIDKKAIFYNRKTRGGLQGATKEMPAGTRGYVVYLDNHPYIPRYLVDLSPHAYYSEHWYRWFQPKELILLPASDYTLRGLWCRVMHIGSHYYHSPSDLWNCHQCGECWTALWFRGER